MKTIIKIYSIRLLFFVLFCILFKDTQWMDHTLSTYLSLSLLVIITAFFASLRYALTYMFIKIESKWECILDYIRNPVLFISFHMMIIMFRHYQPCFGLCSSASFYRIRFVWFTQLTYWFHRKTSFLVHQLMISFCIWFAFKYCVRHQRMGRRCEIENHINIVN